jgi:hypothetical protein
MASEGFLRRNVVFSDHAVGRMFERNISEEDIEHVLVHGEVIESYPDDRPDPSFLLFAMVLGRPLHVVIGLNVPEERCTVIILYKPDIRKFEPDFRTRRKP